MAWSTKGHEQYWRNRKLDWNKAYLATWDHPHRFVISGFLKKFHWLSLIEVGCGSGANIKNIVQTIGGKQLGGMDINPDAIALASKTFQGGMFRVGSVGDIMMSDKSTDVVLSDMVYIYVGPWHIRRYLEEVRRIARNYVVVCEFHSPWWWRRLALFLRSGYYAHHWPRLLDKLGFYDIMSYKLKPEDWPGGDPQQEYGYVFVAKVPKR